MSEIHDDFWITGKDFKRIFAVVDLHTKKGQRRHDGNCEFIIKKYKPVYIADVMLRND